MQKKTVKADIEYRFYNNVPEFHRPKKIFLLDDGIQYERVTGRHPTRQEDWDQVWKAGVNVFWLGLDVSSKDDFYDWLDKSNISEEQFCEDSYNELHPVRLLHGCPRAEHIIMALSGEIIFISPHEPEIVCREWDEAYLLMSMLTLWEEWTRNWSVDHFKQGMRQEIVPPFEVTDVHKMFLLAHWEKEFIVGHKNSLFVAKVIFELEKDWSPVELREKMISLVCKQ